MARAWMKGMAAALAFGLLLAQAGFAAEGVPARAAAKAVGEGQAALPTSPLEKASYSIGVDTVRYLKQKGIQVDQEFLVKGLQDAFSGNKLLLDDQEIQEHLMLIATDVITRTKKAQQRNAEVSKKDAEAFFAANKGTQGVVTLPSGLQYMIITAAEGRKPTDADTVACSYRGILPDGTVFGTTDGKEPSTFNLSDTKNVIPGLREALKLMPVGSKWRIFVPPELAYGAEGSGTVIGPYAILIFDLELIAIK
jgi:FKBP-type peptidyl-prolyl cis-trans isomerase